MKSCVPYGKYILAVFVMRKIQEIVVFLMINSMCSLCRIRYGNFFVFVVDGVLVQLKIVKSTKLKYSPLLFPIDGKRSMILFFTIGSGRKEEWFRVF